MALLHLLANTPSLDLVVAHFDHGIRTDSAEDRVFVQKMAAKYNLPFVFAEAKLGPNTSEATARHARYDFLRQAKQQHQAEAIVTAHHQDDVLETAILNLSRGTGRRGLTSLADLPELRRPLLHISKKQLVVYANKANLKWCEDSTNANQKYLRNYIRHTIVPLFSSAQRQQFLIYIEKLRVINNKLDNELALSFKSLTDDNQLTRKPLNLLPPEVIKELLTHWWRINGFFNYESKTLNRAVHDLCSGKTGAIIPLKGNYRMVINKQCLALQNKER